MTIKVGEKSDAINLINKKDVVSHSSCQTTTSSGIENTICYMDAIQGNSYNSTNKRSIGKNYKNEQFNFTKIIKSDLWNDANLFEYQYTLSKSNIENIRRDTVDSKKKLIVI